MPETALGFLWGLDWGSVPDWVVASAALMAAVQGWRSLSAWRREAGGRRTLELAEELLTRVYEVADAISSVRSPYGHMDENNERLGRQKEERRLRAYRDMYYPIVRRLQANHQAFITLAAQSARSRALFGDELQSAFNEVIGIRNEVAEAANELLHDLPWEGQQTEERFSRHIILRSKIWQSDEDDAIAQRLAKAVTAVEGRLRPIIQRAVA